MAEMSEDQDPTKITQPQGESSHPEATSDTAAENGVAQGANADESTVDSSTLAESTVDKSPTDPASTSASSEQEGSGSGAPQTDAQDSSEPSEPSEPAKIPLAAGDRVQLGMRPPYFKTADPMPMLRPPDLVSVGQEGIILSRRPGGYWAVRFDNGAFLLEDEYLRPVTTPSA